MCYSHKNGSCFDLCKVLLSLVQVHIQRSCRFQRSPRSLQRNKNLGFCLIPHEKIPMGCLCWFTLPMPSFAFDFYLEFWNLYMLLSSCRRYEMEKLLWNSASIQARQTIHRTKHGNEWCSVCTWCTCHDSKVGSIVSPYYFPFSLINFLAADGISLV